MGFNGYGGVHTKNDPAGGPGLARPQVERAPVSTEGRFRSLRFARLSHL